MSQDERIWRTACALNVRAGLQKPLPPLFFITDPRRTPDPAAVAARLPAGAGVIFRGFGTAEAPATAQALAEICRARSLRLLIGQDADLAQACGADGVHLPERALDQAPALRRAHPRWLVTGAAHSAEALARAAEAGLDAALLSPVLPSASPSAGRPLGVEGFTGLVRAAALPVYALGGITADTAPALLDSGAAGLAAVEGVLEAYGAER